MQRTLKPELLDALAPDDPAALHNRRDLRLTNLLLGNHRWLVRTLPRLLHAGETLLEVGAGTGELAHRLHRRGLAVDGLDLWPAPAGWPSRFRWHRADLLTFPGYSRYGAITGNLIFHQFTDADLNRLGAALQAGPRVIVACEPARRRVSQILFRAFAPCFGANYVTLHDAHVSIAAGFRGQELPAALGLASDRWRITCTTTVLGLCRMIAVRQP